MTDIEKRAEEIAERTIIGLNFVLPESIPAFRMALGFAVKDALESLEAEVKKARREAIEDVRKVYRTRGGDNSWDWFKEADEAILALIPKED